MFLFCFGLAVIVVMNLRLDGCGGLDIIVLCFGCFVGAGWL